MNKGVMQRALAKRKDASVKMPPSNTARPAASGTPAAAAAVATPAKAVGPSPELQKDLAAAKAAAEAGKHKEAVALYVMLLKVRPAVTCLG